MNDEEDKLFLQKEAEIYTASCIEQAETLAALDASVQYGSPYNNVEDDDIHTHT
jgi:hypothetical protein